MKLMPNIDRPRTSVTPGAASSDDVIGYVTWSSTRSGERPIHSVNTITCGSDRSGMASSGVSRRLHTAAIIAKPTPRNTILRFRALSSMILSIMAGSPTGRVQRARQQPGRPALRWQPSAGFPSR